MTNIHQTPLTSHLKGQHLWFDLFFLVILWILVLLKPFKLDALVLLIKILSIVATLELVSFFLFHLLGHKKSLLLQGFIGGFISSTAVFMQLNNDKKFANTQQILIAEAQIFAICSMLIECIIITVTIANHFTFIMILPFIIMLVCLLFSNFILIFFKRKNDTSTKDTINFEVDHPILWKKVITFSLYISLLKYLLSLLQKYSDISDLVGSFLASLFEAHAILAVTISNINTENFLPQFFKLVGAILLGSTLSKLFFVLRGKILKRKRLVIIPMTLSLFLTLILLFYMS